MTYKFTPVRDPQTKSPGTAALVLSILGFCGFTAILGVILGFVARGEAKRKGLGTGKATAAIVIGLVWLAPIVIAVSSNIVKPNSSSETAVTPSNDSSPSAPSETVLVGGAWTVCKENLLKQLKAPSTAEFPAFSSNDIQSKVTGNVVGIVAWVDAENSFGTKLRSPFTCSANYDPSSDSYFVLAELNSSTMPKASGASDADQLKVITLLKMRGFACSGPQGERDAYQCKKGTVKVPTYGTQPKELINIKSDWTGLTISGYATSATAKVLKPYGVEPFGEPDHGAYMLGN